VLEHGDEDLTSETHPASSHRPIELSELEKQREISTCDRNIAPAQSRKTEQLIVHTLPTGLHSS
jgi:hypothetical protein